MPNRRETIHNFYRQGTSFQEKAAPASSDAAFPFKGNEVAFAVVTRSDLNGYSNWARGISAADRAAQLDAFFSMVVPGIEEAGGVFFRDEGDCIVALFSDYFARGATFDSIESFCMRYSAIEYGQAKLSAKTTVCCGKVAIFQKRHEIATGDWSAEGEPFVKVSRLEQAISSTRQVVFFEEDYDNYFVNTGNAVGPSVPARWIPKRESIQVPGIGAAGGWSDVVRLDYKN